MPIRINLLAEAQALEEMRRRDPVKRAIWAGSVVVVLIVAYGASLMVKNKKAQAELRGYETKWKTLEKQYQAVTDQYKKAGEVERNLSALLRLSTNRFLHGSVLNGLQQTVVDHVQLQRLRVDQTFVPVDPVPAKPPAKGKPASIVEKIVVTIDAKDMKSAEQNHDKLISSMMRLPYFQTLFQKPDALRLKGRSTITDPLDPSKSYVLFTLEGQVPDISRDE
jgi:hypothetical protein